MDNFLIVCIIHICQLMLLSVYVKAEEKYFEIITDPILVDELAVSSAQMEPHLMLEPDVITEADIVDRTIFDLNKKEFLRLCADVIPIDIYGFQFELENFQGPKTGKRIFKVEHIERPENELLQLKMFNCPRISYLDLETNQRHKFFDIYFLSQATDTNSAIVLKRGFADRNMYPQHCITKLSFEKLTELSSSLMYVGTRFPSDPNLNRIFEDLDEKLIANKIITYQTLKRSSEVYVKFTKLFTSFAVCGLPRKHKIHACRQALESNSPHTRLDVIEYFEEPCKKRLVHLSYGSGDSGKTEELYLSRCPPTLNISVPKHLRQTTMFYVASTATRRSVFLFSRFNLKGEKIQPLKVAYNLDAQAMKQDKERARLFSSLPLQPSVALISGESAFKNLKKLISINLLENIRPVQMPLVLASQRGMLFDTLEAEQDEPRFIHGSSGVERAVIEFSHIKKNVFVYEKFRETYTSIDFCYLTLLQRKSVCDEVLSDDEYKFDPNPHFLSQERPCYRLKVALTSLEAEKLQTEMFSMWPCPPSLNHPKLVYYMGKSNLRDAAILYRDLYYSEKSKKLNAIHPVSLFLNINRYKLARLL